MQNEKEPNLFNGIENIEDNEEILDNVVEVSPKEESEVSSNQEIDYKATMQDLQNKFKEIGIVFSGEERKDVINYSKAIAQLQYLLQEQKQRCENIKKLYEANINFESDIKPLEENVNDIEKFFNVVIGFFTNPPSKEFLDLTNASMIMHKIYKDFKDFSNGFDQMNLSSRFSQQEELFTEHLRKIENFTNTVNTKLEHIAKTYKEFGENVANTQKNNMDTLQNEFKKYAEYSSNIVKKLSTALSYTQRSFYVVITLTIMLCIAAGFLVGLSYSKKQEFDNLTTFVSSFEKIKIEEQENALIFKFPKKSQIIDTNETKNIIIEKDKK